MPEPPKIYLDPKKLTAADFDKVLMSKYDIFYRRIVEYILNKIEKNPENHVMAILIDDEDVEYEMILPPRGYVKSLGKAKEYFTKIEEYETCDLIKQIEQQI